MLSQLESANIDNQAQNKRFSKNRYRYYKRIRKDGFNQFKTVPYTRMKAIKYYCLECVGFVYDEMKNCTMPECPLFPYRFGKMPEGKTPNDRKKAIRSHCLECVGDDWEWIRNCPSDLCPVHPYRLSGGQLDKSSLILAEDIKNLSADDGQQSESEQKTAV